jgi:hypothetical protein
MAVAHQGVAVPHAQVVYNPTPPAKPVARKSMSCLSVAVLTLTGVAATGAALATLIR